MLVVVCDERVRGSDHEVDRLLRKNINICGIMVCDSVVLRHWCAYGQFQKQNKYALTILLHLTDSHETCEDGFVASSRKV